MRRKSFQFSYREIAAVMFVRDRVTLFFVSIFVGMLLQLGTGASRLVRSSVFEANFLDEGGRKFSDGNGG